MAIFYATRRAFRRIDMMNLGAEAPDDEYDGIADRASSALVNRGSVEDAIQAVAREFKVRWDVEIGPLEQDRLRSELSDLLPSGGDSQ